MSDQPMHMKHTTVSPAPDSMVFALCRSPLRRLFRSAALAAALIAGGTAHAGVAADGESSVAAWSDRVWSAAKADDLASVHELLAAPPQGDAAALQALRTSVAQRNAHVVVQEKARVAELERRTKELTSATKAADVTLALLHAVNIKYLLPTEQWQSWLSGPEGAALERVARSELDKAQREGDLLLAQEILFRLKTLHDGADTNRYKEIDAELDAINRKVTLIAEFAPRELYRLRKLQNKRLEAAAKAEGKPIVREREEEEEPEFNELFADDWKERLRGITPKLVLMALRQAASEHVTNAGWAPLIDGGLDAVELMLDTPQLVENFKGLGDPEKVAVMKAFVTSQRQSLAAREPGTRIGPSDFQRVLREIFSRNDETVQLPREVILREFGEGATTQLSKQYEDDYSEIIWPDGLRRFRQGIEGNFVGVGILIRHNDKRELLIVNPLEGSPASRAGIRPGDRITAVDGQSTVGWTLNRAVDTITGPVGKPVTLTVAREGNAEALDFKLRRASIKMRSVNGWWKESLDERGMPKWDWWIDPDSGIGYIRLTSFNEDSLDDFMDTIREMRKGGRLKGLALDLRGNPGGLLKSAVAFVNLFVPEGEIVSVQDRDGNILNTFSAERARAALTGLPLVVLINGASASASEIVSGSLQAHGAAIVVGERTFGKGSVQTVQPLQDGENEAAVKVTVQYYLIPTEAGGRRLVHRRSQSTDWGVNPDLLVRLTPSQMEESGEMRLAADRIDEADWNRHGADLRPIIGNLLVKGIDPQLETALMLLQARAAGEDEREQIAKSTKGKAANDRKTEPQ
jgi:carboxyl-terminal processing protease